MSAFESEPVSQWLLVPEVADCSAAAAAGPTDIINISDIQFSNDDDNNNYQRRRVMGALWQHLHHHRRLHWPSWWLCECKCMLSGLVSQFNNSLQSAMSSCQSAWSIVEPEPSSEPCWLDIGWCAIELVCLSARLSRPALITLLFGPNTYHSHTHTHNQSASNSSSLKNN